MGADGRTGDTRGDRHRSTGRRDRASYPPIACKKPCQHRFVFVPFSDVRNRSRSRVHRDRNNFLVGLERICTPPGEVVGARHPDRHGGRMSMVIRASASGCASAASACACPAGAPRERRGRLRERLHERRERVREPCGSAARATAGCTPARLAHRSRTRSMLLIARRESLVHAPMQSLAQGPDREAGAWARASRTARPFINQRARARRTRAGPLARGRPGSAAQTSAGWPELQLAGVRDLGYYLRVALGGRVVFVVTAVALALGACGACRGARSREPLGNSVAMDAAVPQWRVARGAPRPGLTMARWPSARFDDGRPLFVNRELATLQRGDANAPQWSIDLKFKVRIERAVVSGDTVWVLGQGRRSDDRGYPGRRWPGRQRGSGHVSKPATTLRWKAQLVSFRPPWRRVLLESAAEVATAS